MKSSYSILLVFIMTFCWSCSEPTPKVSSKLDSITTTPTSSQQSDGQVSKERFASMLGSASSPQLIDVRTPEEFESGSIDGAVNMNFYDDDFSNQLKTLDQSRPVFIYCKSGGRSGKTYKKLKDMGVGKVYDLKGGFSKWK